MMRWHPDLTPDKIKGVDVFLERFQTRQHVGVLNRDHQKFCFVYDDAYLKAKNILPLGPEFPLTRKAFTSEALFPSLADRLPDPDNPAYADYCTSAGIAVTVKDPIILLATIGKRGPSSFVFEPKYEESFSFQECEKWRVQMGLSMQDFANLFDVSLSILQKMKAGTSSGKEVLQRLELYWRVPAALDYQLQMRGKWLHQGKVVDWTKKDWVGNNYWHQLSSREVLYTQECIQRLKSEPWTADLISKINRSGLNQESMPLMFEIRFADALLRGGLSTQNAYKTGVGNSDVDFLVEADGKRWLIELTSARESDAMRSATIPNRWGGHSYFSGYQASDYDCDVGTAERKKMRNIIFGKVSKDGSRPHKFPTPKIGNYHVIIVDMRGFGGGYNEGDWKDICYGPQKAMVYSYNPETKRSESREQDVTMDDLINALREPQKNHGDSLHISKRLEIMEETRGVFDPNHKDPRSQYVRERLHAIGFICEREYAEGELETILKLYPNPHLLTEEELANLWPLKKHASYDPHNNPYSHRPPFE